VTTTVAPVSLRSLILQALYERRQHDDRTNVLRTSTRTVRLAVERLPSHIDDILAAARADQAVAYKFHCGDAPFADTEMNGVLTVQRYGGEAFYEYEYVARVYSDVSVVLGLFSRALGAPFLHTTTPGGSDAKDGGIWGVWTRTYVLWRVPA